MYKTKSVVVLLTLAVLAVFLLSVGVASADEPHLGPDPTGLFDRHVGAAGPHIIAPRPDAGSANGFINGFGGGYDVDGPVIDFDNPAVIGITNSPLCPLHYLP